MNSKSAIFARTCTRLNESKQKLFRHLKVRRKEGITEW